MWVTCRHQLSVEGGRVRCHYVKNKESQFVVGINEYVEAASLLTFHGNNIEDYEKKELVSNT